MFLEKLLNLLTSHTVSHIYGKRLIGSGVFAHLVFSKFVSALLLGLLSAILAAAATLLAILA